MPGTRAVVTQSADAVTRILMMMFITVSLIVRSKPTVW
jgi:hypothetical protein